MNHKLDEVDLKIIKSLSEDCRKSTTHVAKEAEISRPTAIARIRNLAGNQIIDFGAKVNTSRLGFKLAQLTLETDNVEEKQNIVTKLAACPRVLQLVQTIEKPSYFALVCAENAETLLSAIECLRDVLSARITSWQRVRPIIGETFNLKIFLEKCELAPCGKKCGICSSYQESECEGCPATIDYKGPLWMTIWNPFFQKFQNQTLTGLRFNLPDDFKGNLNIVIVAFRREHTDLIAGWTSYLKDLVRKNRTIEYYWAASSKRAHMLKVEQHIRVKSRKQIELSPLQSEKLHVRYLPGVTVEGPAIPRCYTLTHSDVTGDLFLTIGTDYNREQVSSWHTRLLRDEVLAEWKERTDGLSLHVYCHVSGGFIVGRAKWREAIFRSEMPLVLEAIRHGDRSLFEANKKLDNSSIFVHFKTSKTRDKIEQWGTPAEYILAT